MGKRKPELTLEQHDQLGLKLQKVRDQLVHIDAEITNNFTKKSKMPELSTKAFKAVEKLRSEFDEIMCTKYKHDKTINPEQLAYGRGNEDVS
ncbi:hypothetical protein [Desulfobacula phenolica]|uniref:Uncharacterized protein n=1 Tax=Desulfobacula phenolica TaxID=90732 RepID=A0A1H2I465_9BACT|nr:hypothetical protein [Desulfobacula phenolica]SDU38824.1 hypothetical protein SAMN04487931_107222 [Desulfobacula phenolica]